MQTQVKSKGLQLALYAMFTAVILLFTCLPLRTLGLEISLAMIPIAVGAILLGPAGGAILGGIYGVFSFLQCLGLLMPSAMGIALYAIDPLATIVTCIVPRILCGFLSGLVFHLLKKVDKTKLLSRSAAALLCPLLNTVFFMSALMIFFGNSPLIQGFMEQLGVYNPFLFVLAFIGINGLVETLTCLFLATAVAKALEAVLRKR